MIKNYSVTDLYNTKPDKDGCFLVDRKLVAVNVDMASKAFRISTRRVRQMLQDGKLKGVKVGNCWLIDYPFQIVMGRRGPMLGYQRYEKRTKSRKVIDFNNPVLTKGDGNSFNG